MFAYIFKAFLLYLLPRINNPSKMILLFSNFNTTACVVIGITVSVRVTLS